MLTVASGGFSVILDLTYQAEPIGSPKFSPFLYIHARFSDPVKPSESCHIDSYVLASVSLTTSPSDLNDSRYEAQCTSGSASFLLAYMFPCVRFIWLLPVSMQHRLHGEQVRSTDQPRYGWMANPYPVGTFTQQEASSFSWRTNGADEWCRRFALLRHWRINSLWKKMVQASTPAAGYEKI